MISKYHKFDPIGGLPVCRLCHKVEPHAIHHNVAYPRRDPRDKR